MIDFIRLAIAILPLSLYLLVIAMLRSAKRPTVLSGSLDFLLMGLGVSGMMMVGPVELFFPRAAFSVIGMWTWLLLAVLYLFLLFLIALSLPPKIVIYGLRSKDLIAIVKSTIEEENWQADWLENVVTIPEMGIRGTIEKANHRDSVSHVTIAGRDQDILGWHRLERALVRKSKTLQSSDTLGAIGWYALALQCFLGATLLLIADRHRLQETIAAWFE